MLDLKLLEKKLDKALENETSESLTSWLLNRRLKMYISSLSEGSIESMSVAKLNISQTKSYTVSANSRDFLKGSPDFYNETEFFIAA